ncbi:MAG: hypothetical protein WAN46_02620 [Gammaproteobacteria bacterium]|jgi:hypothetical protein
MQWLIPVAMGLWAVWTWSHEHERERKKELAKMGALYVNPFLSACEDLQSRIYSILELNGLRSLRQRYPEGSYAEETLYLIARYFGWAVTLHRYGPYAQDPIVMGLTEAVRTAFAVADSKHPVGPFNFFHPEQKALGKLVMHRIKGEHGMELDTISCYAFQKRLMAPPLSESASIRESMEALRATEDTTRLPGRERLEEAQYYLVDLLGYLESREGYSLFAGERKKCAYPTLENASVDLKPLPVTSRA